MADRREWDRDIDERDYDRADDRSYDPYDRASAYRRSQEEPFGGAYRGTEPFRRSSPAEPRGPYAGRGPKGYQRSDQRVLEDVNDRLTEHPEIDANDIEVQVQNCEVTLARNG
jgi:osmotically-inducible protein OsmY